MATVPEALAIAVQHHQGGRLQTAEQIYRQILELEPNQAVAIHLLGVIAQQAGKPDEALACYRRALELMPDYAEAYVNLGVAVKAQGKLNEAVACYRQALDLNPDLADAHNNLGVALKDQGKLEEAFACWRRALELKPGFAEAHSNLGAAFKEQGKLDEAAASYRRALELKPDFAQAHSNLLYARLFSPLRNAVSPDCDAKTLYEEHRRWDQQHAAPLAKSIQPHGNDRSPGRRLKIGYVSPDFRRHPVGRFLLPVLESHNHELFEIFCYASVRTPDTMTGDIRGHADVWRDVSSLTDEQVAQAIRQDGIDILVDLTMHMANSRLLAFARKPAPVQVTYLAYCGTTGLSAMDYRLTDPYLDPPDQERHYSEQSIYLAETYWCYRPAPSTPEVSSVPALSREYATFGCLNNFCKVTPPTLAAWCRLLQAMPSARLLLHAPEGSHRQSVEDFLAGQGITAQRLEFVGFLPAEEYFKAYERIDVALDPLTYGGGTTTCDALWMGVPVVSLAGQTAVGRGGVSILSNVGLPELVAQDAEQYVRIAVDLARDRSRLRELRATLRDRMQNSPLMDAGRFTRNLEAAYREMWSRWCVDEPGNS